MSRLPCFLQSYIHYSENISLLRSDRALLRVATRGHHEFLQQKISIVGILTCVFITELCFASGQERGTFRDSLGYPRICVQLLFLILIFDLSIEPRDVVKDQV